MKFFVVCCTRLTEAGFYRQASLPTSIKPYLGDHLRIVAAFENTLGLPTFYNRVIDTLLPVVAPEDVLVFCHDDVSILDFFWIDRLIDALSRYDVVGLAGNARRVPRQPSWLFDDDSFQRVNHATLSGVVGHGTQFPPSQLSIYGPPGREVELLDGLFLATKVATLQRSDVRFDERFKFHFYDLDFCRTARQAHLRLGTASLSVLHQSAGNLGTPAWREAYQAYLDKWQS